VSFQLSERSKSKISELLPKYPNKMAACLPTLWIVQDEHGWISADAERFVAETLDLPVSHVHGVVSFYTMEIGIKSGGTSADGRFTVQEAECLAACGTAPCVQINDVFLEPVAASDVAGIVEDLRSCTGVKMLDGNSTALQEGA